jgi:predicted DNA-binding WGR domain protein
LDGACEGRKNPPTPKSQPKPLHLRRIDVGRTMRRSYALPTQPTLFGEMSLIRNWGRIGTNGKTIMQTFDGTAEAVEAFGRLERAKRRRVTLQSTKSRRSLAIFSGITALPMMPALSVPRPRCQTEQNPNKTDLAHDHCQ